MDRIELLAPAGDYSCFLAAMNAGADAIYLSGEKFGARAYAKNFSEPDLIKAIDYAHIFDKKVFLTVNTLLKDSEMAELFEYLLPFYKAGLDGVIVQDMGVISCIRRWFPDMPVHASTQLTITGLEGVNLLEKMGVKRVVLAREVSLKEIEYIHNHSKVELETFVHGALCYSYSGKCLFSSMVGGRSGNRGRCAGSCRQPYNGDKYILSTKDICCLKHIPKLIEAGICSLKIEGRMKSPEYVYGVCSIYRKYLDIYYNNNNTMSSDELYHKYFENADFKKDFDTLTKLYTRGGNSEGYYFMHNGKGMISLSDASYLSDKGEVKDQFSDLVNTEKLKIAIDAKVHIYPDENISLLINDSVYVEGAKALIAENKPIDKESVKKQLNKTKDTEFTFRNISYDISNNAFVRISDLNDLRRKAIEKYREELVTKFRRNTNSKNIDRNSDSIKLNKNSNIPVFCEITTKEQLYAVLNEKRINRVYVPHKLLLDKSILNLLNESGVEVYTKFQSVIRYNYLENNKSEILKILDLTDGVLVDSHEVIEFLNSNNYEKPIIGDIHIYALNKEAAFKYNEMSLSTLTVPVELNKKEILKRNISGEELLAYGYIPMMISAQCVNRTTNGCDKENKFLTLRDRKGANFTAVNHCDDCFNMIYNNVPLSLHNDLEFARRINAEGVRLSFTIEDINRTSEVTRLYCDLIDVINNCKESLDKDRVLALFKDNSYTKGHLNRGVL